MNSLQRRLEYRRKRRSDFDLFMSRANNEFLRIADSDPRASDFKNLYGLCIVPGGRNGGDDKRCVDVFFGNRAFDQVIEHVSFENGKFKRRHTAQQESGAMLQYYRQNDDTVVVFLRPAGTLDGGSTLSDTSIIIDTIKNTKLLSDPCKLERHWRCLIAMMEVSSIDGIPKLSDNLLMVWLWLTGYEIKDNRASRRRMWTWISIAAAFFFTVGLSGWALPFVKAAFCALLNCIMNLASAARAFVALLASA